MAPWGRKEGWDLGACLEIQDQKYKEFILFTITEVLELLFVTLVSRRGITLNPPLW